MRLHARIAAVLAVSVLLCAFIVAGIGWQLSEPPPLELLAVSLLLVIAAASVAVSWPLARRIRRLREALDDIGRGQWAKRIDEDEGALADLARSINRAVGELQTLFEEREALLQAVSHEMGTPLARMRFQLELLEGTATPKQRQRLSTLCDDLDELDELSSELVSWMEADSRRLVSTKFALEPVLTSVLELESSETHQPTRSELRVPEGAFVVAAQRQFIRAIENLVRNAMRYARRIVVVEARVESSHVEIDVRDDGIGIAAEQRTRVLEPFVRIDGSRNRPEGGLGLGLAIVRRIVESHGGTIEVGEAAEGGACITTRWPVLPVPRREPTGSFEPDP